MKIKILNRTEQSLQFMIENTDAAFANSLRRIMITEIPTMAIEWINVHENNSALFDEIISHRMGLIPIKFSPTKFNFPEDCTCGGKGCPNCQVTFVLDKKGPCIVTAGDMKSSDKAVGPTDPRIPIVQLLENQSLKLEAVARLGIGASHAKHHAANASYSYYAKIAVTGTKAQAESALKLCPKGSVKLNGKSITVTDIAKSDVVLACLKEAEGVDAQGDESRIIFNVESISGLDPEYIVSKSAEILETKAVDFKKHVSKL